jgi:hypothetical protein
VRRGRHALPDLPWPAAAFGFPSQLDPTGGRALRASRGRDDVAVTVTHAAGARITEPVVTICRYTITYSVELGESERWGKQLRPKEEPPCVTPGPKSRAAGLRRAVWCCRGSLGHAAGAGCRRRLPAVDGGEAAERGSGRELAGQPYHCAAGAARLLLGPVRAGGRNTVQTGLFASIARSPCGMAAAADPPPSRCGPGCRGPPADLKRYSEQHALPQQEARRTGTRDVRTSARGALSRTPDVRARTETTGGRRRLTD